MSDNYNNEYSDSSDFNSSDMEDAGLMEKKLNQVNNFDLEDDNIENDDINNSRRNKAAKVNKTQSKDIQEDLDEIEFGQLITVQKKIEYDEKLKIKRNEKVKKTNIENKLKSINSNKEKFEPKEFSAILKPKNKVKNIQKNFRRDPRFDDLSGKFDADKHDRRYSFVKDDCNKYIENLAKLKKDKKISSDADYDLYKKQMNYVKGWVKNKNYSQNKKSVEKEFKQANKKRLDEGKNPIYLKKKQIKHIVGETYKEQRNQDDNKKFLKRKKHREMVQNRKSEKEGNLNK